MSKKVMPSKPKTPATGRESFDLEEAKNSKDTDQGSKGKRKRHIDTTASTGPRDPENKKI